jgi:hypothetical protein
MGATFVSGRHPAAVFRQKGLRVRGPWNFARVSPHSAGLPASTRFRDALEELGGLYAIFGSFLAWRSDWLKTNYLTPLRSLEVRIPPVDRPGFVSQLITELGRNGERLAATLEDSPAWNTASRCAWKGTWEGQPVVVQAARAPVTDAEFDQFARGVRRLKEPGLTAALSEHALAQFRVWLRVPDSVQRERTYIELLAGFPQQTLVEYPRLIPDLCSPGILCWHWVEGETLAGLVREGSPEAAQKLAEAVLEQACLTSVVDAEIDLNALVVAPSGRLVLRRSNRLVAIPAAFTRAVLQYITSVLSGNSPYANHLLIRLAAGYSSNHLESRLFDELSNLEPELKINLRFPPSVGALESNWRALARVWTDRPLFLDALHRNLLVAGYLDAESTKPGTVSDAVADSHWPVLGRLLRTRISELSMGDVGAQWLMGGGLLGIETMRQVSRLADGLRDNDLSLTLAPSLSEEASRDANRVVRNGVIVAVLVAVFLVCLRWGPQAPPASPGLVAGLALISAAGLLWMLSRSS